MGQVVTFYSYKGGVGRTMALANIATLMSQWGYKTLLVDWDLEAPGLEFYFQDFIDVKRVAQQRGLVDLLWTPEDSAKEVFPERVDWQDVLIEIEVPEAKEKIHLITAGQRDDTGSYFDKVTCLDWDSFYQHKGGFLLESLRDEWKEKYDYILIDSRTGITDIGGICTIQLPDVLVLLFTATEQSLNGAIDVAAKAQAAQWDLPFDRVSLTCLPIASRFDSSEEFKISQQWLDRFSKDLKNLYDDWLPRSVNRKQFLEVTKIPHSSYFSFGEKLPVIEQGTTDPAGLGYAYENIAAIISNNFESVEKLLANRNYLIDKQLYRKANTTVTIIYHNAIETSIVNSLSDSLAMLNYHPKKIPFGLSSGSQLLEAFLDNDVVLYCVSVKSTESATLGTLLSSAARFLELSGHSNKIIPVMIDDRNKSEHALPVAFDLDDERWINYREVNDIDKINRAILRKMLAKVW